MFGYFKKKNKLPEDPMGGESPTPGKKKKGGSSLLFPVILMAAFGGGVFYGSISPDMVRGILGHEALVPVSAMRASIAQAKKEAMKNCPKAECTETVASAGRKETLDDLGTDTTGRQGTRSSNIERSSSVPEPGKARVETYKFDNIRFDMEKERTLDPHVVNVVLSLSCKYCRDAYGIISTLHDEHKEIPLRIIIQPGNIDEAVIFAAYSLLNKFSPEDGFHFLNYVFNREFNAQGPDWGRNLLAEYQRKNKAFRVSDVFDYWRDRRDVLTQLVKAANGITEEKEDWRKAGVPLFIIGGEAVRNGDITKSRIADEWLKKR